MPCHERNGEITGYNITYYPNIYSNQRISLNVSGISKSSRVFVAYNLSPQTSYTFEVRAINNVSVGPATRETFDTAIPESDGKLNSS